MVVLTFILELPVDVHMPDASGVIAVMPDDGLFAGWRTAAVTALTGALNFELGKGLRPSTRIMFRSTRVRTHLPLQAADATFGIWEARLMPRRARLRRWLQLRYLTWRGLNVTRAVAALTRYVHVDRLPDPDGDSVDFLMDQESLLTTEFDAALRDLNDFLVSLGVAATDLRIGPIAPGDLPARVPVILEYAGRIEGRRVGGSLFHTIHFQMPSVDRGVLVDDVLRDAVALFNSAQVEAEPLFGFFELWRRAELDSAGGRLDNAILELGTAIEVLFSVIVRVVASRKGRSSTAIAGALRADLRNIVVDHLPDCIGQPITHADLAYEGHPVGEWWIRATPFATGSRMKEFTRIRVT